MHASLCPDDFGGHDCLIAVSQEQVDLVRSELPVSREEALSLVSPEFNVAAGFAFESIGQPTTSVENAWRVFWLMYPVIVNYYGDAEPASAYIFS